MKEHFCPAEQSTITYQDQCNWCGEQEPDDIASILACRDMLDAQLVPEADRVIWPESTEQEPVGQLLEEAYGRGQVMWFNKPKDQSMLYTTPPQRTWVGLTDEEAQWLYDNCRTPSNLIDMVEAKLKEKNT